ncbi:pseudaminic acid cytidylyltransferase [Herbaspirillum autotrophicum]|uniref:pseudaminic acid cytidylyltransferase n=1 Tax=Herbaspirillum autotrophicum TaxID=180195 RepID=UPI00067B0708|nr:pseudaminic acid cytidylyltransferase [Herbaspirillum autotrophicum]
MKIAVIPARGGSKRIPRKNIREFCGKPMIAHSILAAQNCGLFDQVIVSTDDSEIAEIAKKWGADVPFIRPPELSDDFVGTTDVVAHASKWAMEHHLDVEAVCCIYATAPFMTPDDLGRGLDALNSHDWAYAFSVTEFAAPIFRSFKAGLAGGVEMFFPEYFSTRSQDLPLAFHDAGQFYWGRPSSWCEKKQIFSPESTPVIIPRWRVQDIDTEDDWIRAELIASAMTLRK